MEALSVALRACLRPQPLALAFICALCGLPTCMDALGSFGFEFAFAGSSWIGATLFHPSARNYAAFAGLIAVGLSSRAALAHLTRDSIADKPMSVAAAFRAGLANFWRLFYGLVTWVFLVVGCVIIVPAVILGGPKDVPWEMIWLKTWQVLLYISLFMLPGYYLYVRAILYDYSARRAKNDPEAERVAREVSVRPGVRALEYHYSFPYTEKDRMQDRAWDAFKQQKGLALVILLASLGLDHLRGPIARELGAASLSSFAIGRSALGLAFSTFAIGLQSTMWTVLYLVRNPKKHGTWFGD